MKKWDEHEDWTLSLTVHKENVVVELLKSFVSEKIKFVVLYGIVCRNSYVRERDLILTETFTFNMTI